MASETEVLKNILCCYLAMLLKDKWKIICNIQRFVTGNVETRCNVVGFGCWVLLGGEGSEVFSW